MIWDSVWSLKKYFVNLNTVSFLHSEKITASTQISNLIMISFSRPNPFEIRIICSNWTDKITFNKATFLFKMVVHRIIFQQIMQMRLQKLERPRIPGEFRLILRRVRNPRCVSARRHSSPLDARRSNSFRTWPLQGLSLIRSIPVSVRAQFGWCCTWARKDHCDSLNAHCFKAQSRPLDF